MKNNDLEVNESLPFYARHLFGVMIFISILIALTLVSASMVLYYSSGSSQLDLSSPGYVSVRNQIEDEKSYSDFSGVGALGKGPIEEFRKLYDERVSKIKSVDIYGGDPLSPESIGIADALVDVVNE